MLFYREDGIYKFWGWSWHRKCWNEEELVFSDQENENFIDNSNCNNIQSPSFYRFVDQSRDPVEIVEDDDGSKAAGIDHLLGKFLKDSARVLTRPI